VASIRFRSVADAELAEAIAWYHARSPEAAARLLEAVDQTLETIRMNPEACPRVSATLRRATVPGFPYRLYYRIFPEIISVVGCVHVRRDPAVWLRRT
jgi:plasmid stabilization system protein ParE